MMIDTIIAELSAMTSVSAAASISSTASISAAASVLSAAPRETSAVSLPADAGTVASISGWRIVATKKSGRQRFYIGKLLDQKRALDVMECRLTVYSDSRIDETLYRGEATVTVHPTNTTEEIRKIIATAAFAASKSRTPHFDLPGPAEPRISIPASGFESGDMEAHMDSLALALFAPDPTPIIADTAVASVAASDSAASPVKLAISAGSVTYPGRAAPRINSLELFLTRKETRIVNSRGVDVSFVQWQGDCEFVVQAEGTAGDVELYDSIAFSEPDRDRLSMETTAFLGLVAERARALPMPELVDIPVILRAENAEAIIGWFHDSARADMVYTKASPFSLGSAIQGSDPVSESLDITAEAFIPGLPQSAPFDQEGFAIAPVPVIRDGIIVSLHGPVRYASRLGVDASGTLPLFSASPGQRDLKALLSKPHLEALVFSDFQLDQMSGSFGAEVRLARYFDGKVSIPVTGGSITGSLLANRATMLRSSELALSRRSLCPVAVMLFSASVTAASVTAAPENPDLSSPAYDPA